MQNRGKKQRSKVVTATATALNVQTLSKGGLKGDSNQKARISWSPHAE